MTHYILDTDDLQDLIGFIARNEYYKNFIKTILNDGNYNHPKQVRFMRNLLRITIENLEKAEDVYEAQCYNPLESEIHKYLHDPCRLQSIIDYEKMFMECDDKIDFLLNRLMDKVSDRDVYDTIVVPE